MTINNEDDLFIYLKAGIPDLEKAADAYSVYDFLSKKKMSLLEVKVRKKHYDDLVIEKAKYDNVIMEAFIMNYTPYYICSTPKGVFAFNLAEVEEPHWDIRSMPKTTSFTNKNQVDKIVGYLNTCSSIQI